MPSVLRFGTHEWPEYRDLRLCALRESPNAFGSTFDVERCRSDSEWAEWLSSGVNSEWNCPLVAEEGNELVGLAWGRIKPSEPQTAYVFQMWVARGSRGLGCGSILLDALVKWAREAKARYVVLSVTGGDTPAQRLYTRAGFTPFGALEPLMPGATLPAQRMRLEL